MLKKKNDIVTRVKAKQSKVSALYCQGHSLHLTIKQLTASNEGDTMGTVDGTCALVKFSTK